MGSPADGASEASTTGSRRGMSVTDYDAALSRDILAVTRSTSWEVLRRQRDRAPGATAVIAGSGSWSYAELAEAALACATRLEGLGVREGTRVAYAFHVCPEWVVLHYALGRLGAVGVPLNLALEVPELEHALDTARPQLLVSVRRVGRADMEAKFGRIARVGAMASENVHLLDVRDDGVVVDDAARAALFDPVERALPEPSSVSPDAPAYLMFTSGSTATPKAVVCPHRALLGAAQGWVYALDLGATDRFLDMLPTFHTGGIACGILAPHLAGAATYLLPAFEPTAAIAAIADGGCTATVGFDTMMTKIMASPAFADADLHSLRKVALGCTPSYHEHLQSIWHFDLLAMTYGSTESGSLAAIVPSNERRYEVRRDTNGRPLPGVEVRIVEPGTERECGPDEPGEIRLRGWSTFHRYDGAEEETEAAFDEAGFFRSGDYGWLDAEGFLYFRGRYKQMVKTGGENVSEREIEIFLERTLPDVQFAQVVGAPDATWGEIVVAFVQVDDATDEPFDGEALRASCRGMIAGYKIPKVFFRVAADEWPQLDNGRPDKSTLRRWAAERTGAGSPG
jgi:fatty-acyl-CoA synthase